MAIAHVPLQPRKPGPLRVITIGRISTPHQREESIEAMHATVERVLRNVYKGPFVLDKIGEQGSGLILKRPKIMEAMARIEEGRYDVVILEDLSRVYRNPAF